MAETNGRNGWIKWLVGVLWGLVVLILLTTVTNVIANDKASRERDQKIKDDVHNNKESIVEIKTDLKHIIRTQSEITGILKRRLPIE